MSNDLLFFLSYARSDDEHRKMGLVQKFFDDLRDSVAQLAGVAGVDREEIGYMDQRKLEPGDEWPNDLAAALGKCCTFVAIMSPTYFQREYCGKEWNLFEQRSKALKKIIPVRWVTPVEGDFPDFATDLHTDFNIEDVPEEQKSYVRDYGVKGKGLQHILLRIESTHGNAYNTVIEKLAARILKAAKNDPLEPLAEQIADLKTVSAKFPKKKNQLAEQNVNDVDGGWVRFVVAAGTRPEMEGYRAQTDIFYPQDDPSLLWRPFAPADNDKVSLLALNEANDLKIIPKFAPINQQIVEIIREAETNKCIAILVVDPWIIKHPMYAGLLRDFDKGKFGNCSVIVAWNLADQLTQDKYEELHDALDDIFESRSWISNSIFYMDAVTSMVELQSAIRDALKQINRVLAPRRKRQRPVGESSFNRRPGITSARTA